jgi:hypothetical protein
MQATAHFLMWNHRAQRADRRARLAESTRTSAAMISDHDDVLPMMLSPAVVGTISGRFSIQPQISI